MSLEFGKTAPELFAGSEDYVMEYQLESERGFHLLGTSRFSPNTRLPLDPAHYTSVNGEPLGQRLMDFEVPDDSWVWMWPQWHVDMTADVDDQGWCYAWRFHSKQWAGRHRFLRSFVRQRVWRRPRIKRHCLKSGVNPEPPSRAETPTVPATDATPDGHQEQQTEKDSDTGSSEHSARIENQVRSVSGSDVANLNSSDVLRKEHHQQERKEDAKSREKRESNSAKKLSAQIIDYIRSFRNDRERVAAIVDYIGAHPEHHEVLVSMRDNIMAQLTFNISKRSLVTKLSDSQNENCKLFLLAPSSSWRDIVLQRGEPEREPLDESEDAAVH